MRGESASDEQRERRRHADANFDHHLRLGWLALVACLRSARRPARRTRARATTPASRSDPQPLPPAAESSDGVRSINLPQQPIDLPDAPGKNLVVANCILCHSTAYITMQPAFPRKVWEANVEKMRKTFGAPVPEQHVPQIVDYLMAIRGEGQPATRPAE
jgi:hypothetical protein